MKEFFFFFTLESSIIWNSLSSSDSQQNEGFYSFNFQQILLQLYLIIETT